MQVEGILHIRIVSSISLPILHVLFLDEAGHHTLCPYGHVLWIHGHRLIQLLLHDRHYWLLCLLAVCQADICCREDRLMDGPSNLICPTHQEHEQASLQPVT